MRRKIIRTYDLIPNNGRKSFYGKAVVKEYSNGDKVLQSYLTDIILEDSDKKLYMLCKEDELTNTTCVHVKCFCGLTKSQILNLDRK